MTTNGADGALTSEVTMDDETYSRLMGAPCPECGGAMDARAARFWADEDLDDYGNLTDFDPESMTCTPCHWYATLGTRTPTPAHFVAAGWDPELDKE